MTEERPSALEEQIARQMQRELDHYTALIGQAAALVAKAGSIIVCGADLRTGEAPPRRYRVVLATGDAADDLQAWANDQTTWRAAAAESSGSRVVQFDEGACASVWQTLTSSMQCEGRHGHDGPHRCGDVRW